MGLVCYKLCCKYEWTAPQNKQINSNVQYSGGGGHASCLTKQVEEPVPTYTFDCLQKHDFQHQKSTCHFSILLPWQNIKKNHATAALALTPNYKIHLKIMCIKLLFFSQKGKIGKKRITLKLQYLYSNIMYSERLWMYAYCLFELL